MNPRHYPRLSDILDKKGRDVVTVRPDGTVLEAMRVLVRHRIGSVVVTDGDGVRGILAERDVLRIGIPGRARLHLRGGRRGIWGPGRTTTLSITPWR